MSQWKPGDRVMSTTGSAYGKSLVYIVEGLDGPDGTVACRHPTETKLTFYLKPDELVRAPSELEAEGNAEEAAPEAPPVYGFVAQPTDPLARVHAEAHLRVLMATMDSIAPWRWPGARVVTRPHDGRVLTVLDNANGVIKCATNRAGEIEYYHPSRLNPAPDDAYSESISRTCYMFREPK